MRYLGSSLACSNHVQGWTSGILVILLTFGRLDNICFCDFIEMERRISRKLLSGRSGPVSRQVRLSSVKLNNFANCVSWIAVSYQGSWKLWKRNQFLLVSAISPRFIFVRLYAPFVSQVAIFRPHMDADVSRGSRIQRHSHGPTLC